MNDGPKLSYDYTALISQLKSEISAGLKLTDTVAIERGDQIAGYNYRPIVGWHITKGEPSGLQMTNVGNLLIEMEEMNSLF